MIYPISFGPGTCHGDGGNLCHFDSQNMTSRTLTIPIAQWGQLTGGFIASTGSRYLSWSPLLANDMERQEFEDFITGSDQGRLMNHGSLPPCYVCPSPDDVILNPAAIS
jgi:hypothetical protein